MTYLDPDPVVRDPARLSAVRASGLVDDAREEVLDRITRLAARLLGAPAAVITIVEERRDFYKSAFGLPGPLGSSRELTGTSLCQLTIAQTSPLVVEDTSADPAYRRLDAVRVLGVAAYAGVALRSMDGFPLGTLAVVDFEPRQWSEGEIEILSELAASAEREIRLRESTREVAARAMESGALIEQLQLQTRQLEAQAEELELQVGEVGELNAALSDSELRFRALAESDPDGIITIDDRSIILYANASLGRIFGYSEEELVGRSLEMLMPQRFRRAHNAGTVRFLGTRERTIPWTGVQVFGTRRDGTEIPIEISFGEYTANGRHVFAGFISDITERKRAEEALNQAKEEAERASDAKSEFLSRMSHELRTPLNSILGFGQLLARWQPSPEQGKAVEHILRAGRHLLNLINEVLEISRIEANQQQLSLEPVSARPLLEEALALIRPAAQQAGIRLDFADTAPAEACVRADQQRLMQVMLNLLSNAVKYNRPGGSVQLGVRREGSVDSGGSLSISVRDTGPGIAADRLDELFVPFSRLDAERAGIEGTGLGLVLSRRLVEAMGGQLRVESEPGEGSTFHVDLPLAADQRQSPTLPREAIPVEGLGDRPARTVLYVEDNLANLDLVESILLHRPEIRLIPAQQGRLGLELAREHDPDLILLDLHLPDVPGELVLKELGADPRTSAIPVLVISADATQRQMDRLRASGVQDYLTKPIDVDQFLAAVDAGLAAH